MLFGLPNAYFVPCLSLTTLDWETTRFGKWVEIDNEAELSDGKLTSIRFTFAPESPVEGQHFQIIGTLSSMVSNGYRELTVEEDKVVALSSTVEPSAFSPLIPEDYRGISLPLWQIVVKPNQEFKSPNIATSQSS